MRLRFAVILLALCSASAAHAASPAKSGATMAPTTKTTAAKLPNRPLVVPFIEDDFTNAVAEARARKVPLFVEAWAPW